MFCTNFGVFLPLVAKLYVQFPKCSCKNGTGLFYHHAKFGGARTSHATIGIRKGGCFIFCLFLWPSHFWLTVCDNNFAIKTIFDIISILLGGATYTIMNYDMCILNCDGQLQKARDLQAWQQYGLQETDLLSWIVHTRYLFSISRCLLTFYRRLSSMLCLKNKLLFSISWFIKFVWCWVHLFSVFRNVPINGSLWLITCYF